ncbi:hypothetical protein ACWA1F_01610 [Flavobacterium sp. 3-218]
MLKKLEDLVKFFPLLFVVLTTLGYIHLQCYYYFFDIEILNYLDLSEIILLFFDKSILLILGLLLVIAISYILDDKLERKFYTSTKEESSRPKIDRNKRFFKIIKYFLFFTLALQIISNLIRENYIGLVFPIGFIISIIIFFLFEKFFFRVFLEKYSSFFFLSFTISLAVVLLINLNTISSVLEKGYNLRHNHQTIKQVSFYYNNKIVKTSNKLFYIGETKKNLFLFDSQKSETLIFKMENIDNLRIKNK